MYDGTRRFLLGIAVVAFLCATPLTGRGGEPTQDDIICDSGVVYTGSVVCETVVSGCETAWTGLEEGGGRNWARVFYLSEVGQVEPVYAGQTMEAGTVEVIAIGPDVITLEINTQFGWVIEELHAAAGKIPSNKKGNFKIGKFPVNETFESPVMTTVFDVPIVGDAHPVPVAVHAVVCRYAFTTPVTDIEIHFLSLHGSSYSYHSVSVNTLGQYAYNWYSLPEPPRAPGYFRDTLIWITGANSPVVPYLDDVVLLGPRDDDGVRYPITTEELQPVVCPPDNYLYLLAKDDMGLPPAEEVVFCTNFPFSEAGNGDYYDPNAIWHFLNINFVVACSQ